MYSKLSIPVPAANAVRPHCLSLVSDYLIVPQTSTSNKHIVIVLMLKRLEFCLARHFLHFQRLTNQQDLQLVEEFLGLFPQGADEVADFFFVGFVVRAGAGNLFDNFYRLALVVVYDKRKATAL